MPKIGDPLAQLSHDCVSILKQFEVARRKMLAPLSPTFYLPPLAKLKDFYNCLSNLCSTRGNQFVGLSIDKRNFNAELQAQPFSRGLCAVVVVFCCSVVVD